MNGLTLMQLHLWPSPMCREGGMFRFLYVFVSRCFLCFDFVSPPGIRTWPSHSAGALPCTLIGQLCGQILFVMLNKLLDLCGRQCTVLHFQHHDAAWPEDKLRNASGLNYNKGPFPFSKKGLKPNEIYNTGPDVAPWLTTGGQNSADSLLMSILCPQLIPSALDHECKSAQTSLQQLCL
jgi:hypothetical protein